MEKTPQERDITEMQARITELEKQVADLQRELGGARSRIDLTMRGQLRCPACGCRTLVQSMFFRFVVKHLNRVWTSLMYLGYDERPKGRFEMYVCTECGRIEWYVQNPKDIADRDKFLRIIRGEPPDPGGPYR